MADTIHCPNCHAEIPLSDAVTHSLREQFNREFSEKEQVLHEKIVSQQKTLEAQKETLAQRQLELDAEVQRKLEAERRVLVEKAGQQAREQYTVQMQDLQAQLSERVKLLNEAQKNELQLRQQASAVEARAKNLDLELARKLEVAKSKVFDEAKRQATEEQQLRQAEKEKTINDLQAQLTERAKLLGEAQQNELKLRQQATAVEERAKNLDLELARKLETERSKVFEDAKRQATEEQQLRQAEKEKTINDLKTQIEILKQKAEQGSQQLQGEVLELQLEDLLRNAFPHDEILPVPTGTKGADLLQHVHNALGQKCGTIIWESKRTRNWSQPWLGKLKDDQRAQSADLAILVSQALPDGVTHSAQVEGVWVCAYTYALPLATALRNGLLQVASVKRAESGKEEKMEVLYRFLTSAPFRQQVEGVVEAFVEMKRDLDSERRAMERLWKKREMQLTRVLNGTSSMYGSLQGIIGSAALPEIRSLELGGEDDFKLD